MAEARPLISPIYRLPLDVTLSPQCPLLSGNHMYRRGCKRMRHLLLMQARWSSQAAPSHQLVVVSLVVAGARPLIPPISRFQLHPSPSAQRLLSPGNYLQSRRGCKRMRHLLSMQTPWPSRAPLHQLVVILPIVTGAKPLIPSISRLSLRSIPPAQGP